MHNLTTGSKVKICFHIDTDKSKEWYYDNWLKVIDKLIGYSKFEIVLLGQPKLAKKNSIHRYYIPIVFYQIYIK